MHLGAHRNQRSPSGTKQKQFNRSDLVGPPQAVATANNNIGAQVNNDPSSNNNNGANNSSKLQQLEGASEKKLRQANGGFIGAGAAPNSAKQCEIHHSAPFASALGHQHHHLSLSMSKATGGSAAKKSVNFCRAWLNKFPTRSKRIDVISRIFFPKMFALFNLVYWTTYLFREEDIVRA